MQVGKPGKEVEVKEDPVLHGSLDALAVTNNDHKKMLVTIHLLVFMLGAVSNAVG